MTSLSFDKSLKAVLVHEGGFSDHPADPGGKTMKGVIQRVYDGYRKRKGRAPRSVRQIEDGELREIYKAQYWDVVRGDDLPAGVDYAVFDGAVNSGPSQSVKWLQRALGNVKVDGAIGEATLAAVASHPDHDRLIAAICERRMAFLKALKTWGSFGKGWTARVDGVRKLGQAWASGSVGPAPVYSAQGAARAVISDAKPAATKGAADAATGASMGFGAAGAALNEAKDALTPLAGSGGWIDSAVAALALTSALGLVGGIGWRWYASRRDKERADALDLVEATA